MARADDTELIDSFEEFYRSYYRNEIGQLAQKYPNEQKSLYIDWEDLYRFEPHLADDFRNKPEQLREYAEEALRLYDLPVDVSLGQAHVRVKGLPEGTDIRAIRSDHRGMLIAIQGIVRKATDVRPKITTAAFECQRCGTLSRIPQEGGDFQEPHECQGCERQGPFRINYDQSEFIDAQKLRVQESPEGLRGGETPQSVDVNIEDDITGEVTAGDHVKVTGILKLDQQGSEREKSPMFDFYMEGMTVEIEDEQFEEMDITDEDKKEIIELSNEPDIYEKMEQSIAPSIYGYEKEKRAMIFQLFSGVTKHLPDGSRTRGDLHMLLIGDPGTGKSQMLQYVKEIAPRSVYTSGKGSSSAGLTAAAVRDDFGDGQQWTLEAGALVLADQGIAAVDELDKMRCVSGETLVHTADGVRPIREFAFDASGNDVEYHENGRTYRDVDATVWTMTDEGQLTTRDVTAIHEYDAPDTLHEVALESGERLTTTADHPFFVLEDGKRVEKPAEDLEPDDWVYVPDTIPQPASDGGVATLPGETRDESPPGLSGITPAHGAVMGYIAGDGNIYCSDEQGYGIRFTNKEETLLSDFERACREAFDSEPVRPPSEQRSDGVETVHLHGKSIVDELVEAGLNLETYEGKRVPEAVAQGNTQVKASFLRALADSEGNVDDSKVTITSASYELLMGAKMLLSEFDVTSQIQTVRKDDRRDIYVLAITAADSLFAFRHHVGFTLGRKQEALEAVCDRISGERTIIDVLPECGHRFEEARTSLRLHQSECGLNDATYCNFENGDANFSLSKAKRTLDCFENRRKQATEDRQRITSALSWDIIEQFKERYHVSQRDFAQGTSYSQQQVSRKWGQDETLRQSLSERLVDIIEQVQETDISHLRELVRGDVKWRRVSAIERTQPADDDGQIRLLKRRLSDILGVDESTGEARARAVLDTPLTVDSWSDLRHELERHNISQRRLAEQLGVDQSTVSRWLNGVVECNSFDRVRDTVRSLVENQRTELREILTELSERRKPKVFDLTVEGTHNFVANSIVVHNSEDQSAMHEALEQQSISVSKAGINATLKSRCSLLGAANPTYGRFDQYEPIGEQIDLDPPLISRFDLIFAVTDNPNEDEDAELAEHILTTNYAGELNTHREHMSSSDYTEEEVENVTDEVAPQIDAELLRKYIAYAKRNCYPTMTEEAKSEIQEFYVQLRAQGADEDAPVPVTARKLEALVRLAEASARVRLSDTVEDEDAKRATTIARYCLEDIGMDPETGEFDADVIETGTSKSQRDRIKNIKHLISNIEEEYDEGAPVDVIIERAEEEGIETSKAEHEIEKLKQKGEVYEPRTDHLRTT